MVLPVTAICETVLPSFAVYSASSSSAEPWLSPLSFMRSIVSLHERQIDRPTDRQTDGRPTLRSGLNILASVTRQTKCYSTYSV